MATFWSLIQIAMIAGFLTALPANTWLIRKGWKEKMPQVDPRSNWRVAWRIVPHQERLGSMQQPKDAAVIMCAVLLMTAIGEPLRAIRLKARATNDSQEHNGSSQQ